MTGEARFYHANGVTWQRLIYTVPNPAAIRSVRVNSFAKGSSDETWAVGAASVQSIPEQFIVILH
jgi:hypothetical protein